MDRKETRVTASCNGVPTDLLSVRELANNDLLLVLRNAQYRVEVGRKMHSVLEQRYLLRLDPVSNAVLIRHSLRIANGRILTIADFPGGADAVHAWPIFSRLLPHLPSRNPAAGRLSGTTVDMGEFDPRTHSLCYSVIAHRRQKFALASGQSSISLARLAFREFDISIAARILNQPTTDGGLMHHNANDRMRGAASEVMAESDVIALLDDAADLLAVSRYRPATRDRMAG